MKIRPLIGTLTAALLVSGLIPFPSAVAAEQKHIEAAETSALWRPVEESLLEAKAEDRLIVPNEYRVYEVDSEQLSRVLRSAPLEFSGAARSANVVLTIPMPDGSTQRFRITESPVMEPELARQFPEIKTYVAQGIDDPAATMRFDRTPLGFHAMILSPNGAVFIDPYRRGDTLNYISYYKSDFVAAEGFSCLTEGIDGIVEEKAGVDGVATGGTLRTYRLALAATGEYAVAVCTINAVALSVANTMAAMTTSVNRITGVYEKDLTVRMVLVASNASIVYTNGTTDPYSNTNPSSMLTQNQTNCDAVIGSANYDIGHVFSTGGGGVAGLGVVCATGSKARGVTGTGSPVGDPFDIDFVAHEMGHQFGGNHTFNGTSGNCSGGNRNATTAYEVGSGSTIQAYAGICGSQDLQPNSDAYFHGKSYDEMIAHTTGTSCAVQTATGNTPPTVDAGAAFTVPSRTPFALTATGADANGDTLTYCWEEFDLGVGNAGTTDNGASPIFRSFSPTTSPTRSFPRLANILSNTVTYGELMPTTSRIMTFRSTVRDNRAGGGGSDFDSTTVTSVATAGPFAITTANTATPWTGNGVQTLTWDVAATNLPPISTANVRILFSADGGATFPFVLAESVANDGSESITVPNFATTTGRIKVEAVGNIYFDINNASITVTTVPVSETVGVYTGGDGIWFLRNSNTPGNADLQFGYGAAGIGWVPIVGDWNGDGRDTPGLYDPATGVFFLRNSSDGGIAHLQFVYGPAGVGWIPLAGDWDGNGIDTIGLYDPTAGIFYLRNSNNAGVADLQFQYGAPGQGWVPVMGDWDGNVTDTAGLYDPVSGVFYLRNSNNGGVANLQFPYGPPGSVPVVGDWNSNNVDTIGVILNGIFFLRNTNNAGFADAAFPYGPGGATPIAGDWNSL